MRLLSKLIAHVMCVLILTSSFLPQGSGFSKDFAVSNLLLHYIEHQEESAEDLSFSEFFMMHYDADSTHRESHPDNLPDLDGQFTVTYFVANTLEPSSISNEPILVFLTHHKLSSYNNQYSFDFTGEVAHPPIS